MYNRSIIKNKQSSNYNNCIKYFFFIIVFLMRIFITKLIKLIN